ncbi:MAG: phage head closure protein [Paeniclostridium sordellii]|nr:phage head closure protein [Paeniclostridium sordellii]
MFNEYEYNTEIDVYEVILDKSYKEISEELLEEGIYAKEKTIRYDYERIADGRTLSNEVVFIIDYRDWLENKHRIKYNDKVFEIVHINVFGREYDKKLEINCIEDRKK